MLTVPIAAPEDCVVTVSVMVPMKVICRVQTVTLNPNAALSGRLLSVAAFCVSDAISTWILNLRYAYPRRASTGWVPPCECEAALEACASVYAAFETASPYAAPVPRYHSTAR
jgi:hypothetical protein